MNERKNDFPKIAFFGTPELTIPILDSLKENNLLPNLIVTGKDMPQGRGLILTSPPPKLWADKNGVRCLQPEKLDDDFIVKLKKEDFDLFVVVAYGKILPEKLINLPRYGTINVHYSLLPKYRGATPVESAILNGDAETGVCIQKMEFKLDTGAILASEKVAIPPEIKAFELRDILNKKAAAILPQTIKNYVSGKIKPIPQDESLTTHCKKIKKEDGLIDIYGDPVLNDRKFRAYSVWPRTYFFSSPKNASGKKIRAVISDAKYEKSAFVIKKVIPEGKKEMSFEQFISSCEPESLSKTL